MRFDFYTSAGLLRRPDHAVDLVRAARAQHRGHTDQEHVRNGAQHGAGQRQAPGAPEPPLACSEDDLAAEGILDLRHQ